MYNGRPGDAALALTAATGGPSNGFSSAHCLPSDDLLAEAEHLTRDLLAGPWPEWTPMADRYLERLQKRSSVVALVSATVSSSSSSSGVHSREASTGSGTAPAGMRSSNASRGGSQRSINSRGRQSASLVAAVATGPESYARLPRASRGRSNATSTDSGADACSAFPYPGRGSLAMPPASRGGAAQELRHMSAACGDAMRQIDELEATLMADPAVAGHGCEVLAEEPPAPHVEGRGASAVVPLNLWPAEDGSHHSRTTHRLLSELSFGGTTGNQKLGGLARQPGRREMPEESMPPWAPPPAQLASRRAEEGPSAEEFQQLALRTFQAFDSEHRGFLPWGGGTIWDFVATVFSQSGLEAPDEGETYRIYTQFDRERNMVLDMRGCLCLVDALFRGSSAIGSPSGASMPQEYAGLLAEAAASAGPPATSSTGGVAINDAAEAQLGEPTSQQRTRSNVYCDPEPAPTAYPAEPHPTSLAEQWVATYEALPTAGTVSITYSSGVVVDFAKLEDTLRPLAEANLSDHMKMLEAIESGNLMRLALELYRPLDHAGYLSWAGGEVLRFTTDVFKAMNLAAPTNGQGSEQVFQMYSLFDSDHSGHLNTSECLCLVDALFRALAHHTANLASSSSSAPAPVPSTAASAVSSAKGGQLSRGEALEEKENSPCAEDRLQAFLAQEAHAQQSLREGCADLEQHLASLRRDASAQALSTLPEPEIEAASCRSALPAAPPAPHEDAASSTVVEQAGAMEQAEVAGDHAPILRTARALRGAVEQVETAGDHALVLGNAAEERELLQEQLAELREKEVLQSKLAKLGVQERESLQVQLLDLKEAADRNQAMHEQVEAKGIQERERLRVRVAELSASGKQLEACSADQQSARREQEEALTELKAERDALEARMLNVRAAEEVARLAHREDRSALEAEVASLRAASDQVVMAIQEDRAVFEEAINELTASCRKAELDHQRDRLALEAEIEAARSAPSKQDMLQQADVGEDRAWAASIDKKNEGYPDQIASPRRRCPPGPLPALDAVGPATSRDTVGPLDAVGLAPLPRLSGGVVAATYEDRAQSVGYSASLASWVVTNSSSCSSEEQGVSGKTASETSPSLGDGGSPSRLQDRVEPRLPDEDDEGEDALGPLPLLSARSAICCEDPDHDPTVLAGKWLSRHTPPLVASTPRITYSPSVSVDFSEFSEAFATAAAANVAQRGNVVKAVENGELLRRTLDTFNAVDKNCDGYLCWGAGHNCVDAGIQRLVTAIFHQQDLSAPTEFQVRLLFERFDYTSAGYLSALECLQLVDALMRCVFYPWSSPHASTAGGPIGHGQGRAEGTPSNGTIKLRGPRSGLARMTYLGSHVIDFRDLSAVLEPLAAANIHNRPHMLKAIETESLIQVAMDAYQAECGGRGALRWADGGIQSFARAVFDELGLHPPTDEQTYQIHAALDLQGGTELRLRQCLALADALVRGAGLWEEASHLEVEPTSQDRQSISLDSNTVCNTASQSQGTVASPCSVTLVSPVSTATQSCAVTGATATEKAERLDDWVLSYSPPPIEGTARIMYLGKVQITFRPLPSAARSSSPEATVAAKLVKAIESGEAMREALYHYQECEILGCGFLTSKEVPGFLAAVFQKYGLEPPNEELIDWTFKLFDPDGSLYLDARDCLCLAEALLRTVCISAEAPCRSDDQSPQRATYSAEDWAMSYTAPPMDGTHRISYLGSITITFSDFSAVFESVAESNALHYERVANAVETGDLVRSALKVYKEFDRNPSEFLSWDNDEIWGFVSATFRREKLVAPTKPQIYELFRAFDRDSQQRLDASECLCLVDSIVRAMFCSKDSDVKNLAKHSKQLEPSSFARSQSADEDAAVRQGDDEKLATGNLCPPPIGTPSIIYLDGLVEVDFARLYTVFAPLGKGGNVDQTEGCFKVTSALEDGTAANVAWQIYQRCDKDTKGCLDWQNNEIQRFVTALFRHHGFALPSEEQIYHLYMIFDVDRSLRLSTRACICLADAALRTVLHTPLDRGSTARSAAKPLANGEWQACAPRPAKADAQGPGHGPATASSKDSALPRMAPNCQGSKPDAEVDVAYRLAAEHQFHPMSSSALPDARESPRKTSFDSRQHSLHLELSDDTEPSSLQSPISLVTPIEGSSLDMSVEQQQTRHAISIAGVARSATAAEAPASASQTPSKRPPSVPQLRLPLNKESILAAAVPSAAAEQTEPLTQQSSLGRSSCASSLSRSSIASGEEHGRVLREC